MWQLEETGANFRCLIRDNDKKSTKAFDTVFESQQTQVIPTPIQEPKQCLFKYDKLEPDSQLFPGFFVHHKPHYDSLS